MYHVTGTVLGTGNVGINKRKTFCPPCCKRVSQHGMSEMKRSKRCPDVEEGGDCLRGYQSLSGDHLFHCVAVLGDYYIQAN